MKGVVWFVCWLSLSLSLPAALRVASIFQDHAVLQRDCPVPVWGETAAGETVTVSYRGQAVSGTADALGRWRLVLPALTAEGVGSDLVIATTTEKQVLQDIVIGEVWLCSGQSNMEWSVARAADAEREIAAADHPSIRQIKIGNVSSLEPANAIAGAWRVCSPETVGNFSAVGYYFARDIAQRLQVPIGIINSSWGGTPIEAWMSEAALLSEKKFDVVYERWARQISSYPERKRKDATVLQAWTQTKKTAEDKGEVFADARPRETTLTDARSRPSGLFGGMIAPLAPYALRGIVWYQGENNAGRAGEYERLLGAWLRDWRRHWPDASCVIVQLPNFKAGNANGTSWAQLREAQARVAASEPRTNLVVTIDQGNPDDVHPLQKIEVGHRVALAVRAAVHGEMVVSSGPTVAAVVIDERAVRVTFSVAEGLHFKAGEGTAFEVAGGEDQFFPAQAVVEGASVTVTCAQVTAPVAVRYAWSNAPLASLFNAAGLPAAPFRLDARRPEVTGAAARR